MSYTQNDCRHFHAVGISRQVVEVGHVLSSGIQTLFFKVGFFNCIRFKQRQVVLVDHMKENDVQEDRYHFFLVIVRDRPVPVLELVREVVVEVWLEIPRDCLLETLAFLVRLDLSNVENVVEDVGEQTEVQETTLAVNLVATEPDASHYVFGFRLVLIHQGFKAVLGDYSQHCAFPNVLIHHQLFIVLFILNLLYIDLAQSQKSLLDSFSIVFKLAPPPLNLVNELTGEHDGLQRVVRE